MYKVFGYTDDCRNFELVFDSFVKAIKRFRELSKCNIVFIRRGNNYSSCLFV